MSVLNLQHSSTRTLRGPMNIDPLRLCFIVEEKYQHHAMPAVVAEVLADWGHDVDVLRPHDRLTSLTDLADDDLPLADGYVLKTVSGGPGMSILEAAGAAGRATVNDHRAVRITRDKAVGASLARAAGLPFPQTWFAPRADVLRQLPRDAYPLVVKPSNGSSCEQVHRLDSPADLERLDLADAGYLLAQRYLPNAGYDLKLYNTGDQVWAAVKHSPLHPGSDVEEQLVRATPELTALALRVGRVFGLDLYGVDVIETARGWVVVDVNDFPSFGHVPQAPERLARTILRITHRAASAARAMEATA